MLKQCLLVLAIVFIIIAVYCPTRHARHYEYIKLAKAHNSLQLENTNFMNLNQNICNYEDIILNNEDVEINSIQVQRNFSKPLTGKILTY